jgi:hypothetical protein
MHLKQAVINRFELFIIPMHPFGLLFHEQCFNLLQCAKKYKVIVVANLQVKSIDDELYQSLGKRAAMENRSISQEVVSILKAHLSIPSNKTRQVNNQFLELCGTWEGDKSADEMIKEIRNSRLGNSKHRELDF